MLSVASETSLMRLQVILSKKLGRTLSAEELQIAYNNLMAFATALIELDEVKELN